MSTTQDSLDRCQSLIDAARKAGASAAEAVHAVSTTTGIGIRLGNLEDAERSENEQLGLRVFVGQQTASINVTSASANDVIELAERAVAMAKAAPEDRYAQLAKPDQLAKAPFPDLDMADSAEPDPATLRAQAQAAEDAGRSMDGITNSDGAGAEFSQIAFTLATSEGFVGQQRGTRSTISASLVGGEGSNMQRDYDYRTARYASDLPDPASIGKAAAERTLARLNPEGLPSKAMPVVFDPRVGSSLIGHFIGAINGSSAARRSTFLLDKIEEQIFDSAITFSEDPHKLRGLASRPFDSEGLPTQPRKLVENGRPTGWITNLAAAQQLGIEPTGHASRSGAGSPGITTSNVTLEPGSLSREELIADIIDGVFVTELIGQGVNGVTGDYSRGAAGFRIINGAIAGPVAEFTVAGNLIDMFAALTPANDLEDWRSVIVPTIRVDSLTVAGE